jgi:hypothetical protein
MWLPVTALRKIGSHAYAVNVTESSLGGSTMSATLLLAVSSLLVWAVLLFGTSISYGSIHLLLAVGATLLVRWWALRA